MQLLWSLPLGVKVAAQAVGAVTASKVDCWKFGASRYQLVPVAD